MSAVQVDMMCEQAALYVWGEFFTGASGASGDPRNEHNGHSHGVFPLLFPVCFVIKMADCSMAIFQFTGYIPHVMMIHPDPLD